MSATPPVSGSRRDPAPPAGKSLAGPPPVPAAGTRTFWLSGDVLACACPDCQAPMSVRLWLMLADCWRCGTSIELTVEEQRAAEKLLAAATANRTAASPTKPATTPATPPTVHPAAKAAQPSAVRRTAAPIAPPVEEPTQLWLYDVFDDLPAWLASLIIHLVLLILLTLWNAPAADEAPSITLSATIGKRDEVGGNPLVAPNSDLLEFEMPTEQPASALRRDAQIKAEQAARELRLDAEAERRMPALAEVRSTLHSRDPEARMLAPRDPRLRRELIDREGGTVWTEAAVARGLRWLADHQNDDGSWSLDRFSRSPNCKGKCGGEGYVGGRTTGTSLALLGFLGAGQTLSVGRYKDVVARGVRYLLDRQRADGDLSGDTVGNGRMYVHGQATIVLSEALAMTGSESLRGPVQKAVEFIVAAQHVGGGWRYRPKEQPGDTSVIGWQLMALYSARSATLSVPKHTLLLADVYLDSAESPVGSGQYGYLPGQDATPAMTAEALLCRFYLGATKDDASLELGIRHLLEQHPPDGDAPNFYYWYYATQAMHHWGGTAWERWNDRMRTVLVELQEEAGHQAGSWMTTSGHDHRAGRLYATSLAVCTLEVYYRHAPLFRQIDLRKVLD